MARVREAVLSWCARALAASLIVAGACGHEPPPPAAGPEASGGDPAPGARPEERNHLLEATWKEVVVKVEKDKGKSVAAAVKLVAPNIRQARMGPRWGASSQQ